MESPFLDPAVCNHAQLIFLTVVYAVVLYQASNLITAGSELLMLVPAVAGLVGSIVLPILGAVPDGMMVLFSGIGPDAKEKVAVGVGALAGSTVMLLTFPWFICVMFGRAPIKDGRADYASQEKVTCTNSGITFQNSISKTAAIMLATTFLYFIIQIPATRQESLGVDTESQAEAENSAAFVGLLACALSFVGYLLYCFFDANEDKQLAQVVKGIERRQITIAAALEFIWSTKEGKQQDLLDKDQARLKRICKPFFRRYDYDNDKLLSRGELKPLLKDLGIFPDEATMRDFLDKQDINRDGQVSLDEFTRYLQSFIRDPEKLTKARENDRSPPVNIKDDEDDEEQEAVPEDLADLSPKKQLFRVLFRSLWMMGLGTALVLVFSDPMVDALSEWGTRLGISPFYVSFVLAPFASNASELLSAYTYAVKKTEKNITTSLSTLVGAACMNNTFVLGIFLSLIYLKELPWQFAAETTAMVLIQWIIGLMAIAKRTQTMFMAFIILACYPGCLFVVWFLENKMGWD